MNLPIREYPPVGTRAPTGSPEPSTRALFVFYSGDGGWIGKIPAVCRHLQRAGVPGLGIDCLRHFWHGRTPVEAAADLAALVERYAVAWRSERVIVAGYSFGANVVPFVVNRLPERLRERIGRVVLLGAGDHAWFRFRFRGWVSAVLPVVAEPPGPPTAPEVQRLAHTLPAHRVLCLHGEREPLPLCTHLPPGVAETVALPGGHYFGWSSARVAGEILRALL